MWAYRIRIENLGRESVQLLRRTWHITDAHGRTQTVKGAGVIGQQPVLEPGEIFEYTSGTPLETASGFMVGRLPHGAGRFRRDLRRGDPRLQPGQPPPGATACTERIARPDLQAQGKAPR